MNRDNELCPCGSKSKYTECCQQFLENVNKPHTPELLMRSRYTAYVRKHEKYLLNTWHNRTRPQALNFDDNPVVWLGLTILEEPASLPEDNTGSVRFLTKYLEKGVMCSLEEISLFVREEGIWYYLNGECILTQKKPKRNQPCPCGSLIKFKKCCMSQ